MFDWITGVVSENGYLGIIGLMLAENIFPPIPSELIMPLAGFVAAQGELNVVLVVLAGTLGSILGALPWYYAGLWLGRARMCALAARHGRWLTLDQNDMGNAIEWFERRGRWAVLLGRLVPAVRTVISVPAGVARMPMPAFLVYSSIGTLVWVSALTAAGLLLEQEYRRVAAYVDQVSTVIVSLIVLIYVWRLIAAGRLGARVRGWAQTMWRDVHALYFAARDPRVPWYAKVWAVLVAAYAVSPIDLIPDFIPVVGHLDDVILVPLGVMIAVRLIPDHLLEEFRRRADAAAEAPADWRVGALFVAIWVVALAFAVRWATGLLWGT